MINLPINKVLDEIKSKLNTSSNLLLAASAGAGKSTMVPISLLKEAWLENKQILVLQPRRVAVRAVTSQMAKLIGEDVGLTIGYQMKMDSKFCKDTKILVVTEAILTKKIQNDPELNNIACIIFDEFHERSINTDLALALSLQVQELFNEQIKLLLMSATINKDEVFNLFKNNIEYISCDGFMYEVEEIYLDDKTRHPNINEIESLLEKTIKKVIKEEKGDILVFCDGLKTINSLASKLVYKDILIMTLHSSLNKKQQDEALKKQDKRKVILATNIAQTSLTIEGIEVVIDSGLEKISLYDENSSLDKLIINFISKDSAIQRQGRAGRLKKGKCYKLWHKKRILEKSTKPEILRVDLSYFLLNLYEWGIKDLKEVKLIDRPSSLKVSSVNKTLHSLELLDENDNLTFLAKKVLSLGGQIRNALMILKANKIGQANLACKIASLIENKNDSFDFEKAFDLFKSSKLLNKQKEFYLNALKKCEELKDEKEDLYLIAILILFAYPYKLAKKAKNNIYNLANKKQALLKEEIKDEYIVVSSLNSNENKTYINSYIKIDKVLIDRYFKNKIKKELFLEDNEKVSFKEKTLFEELVLEEKAVNKVDKNLLHEAIYNYIKENGIETLFDEKDKKLKALIDKIEFYNKQDLDNSLDLKEFSLKNLSLNAKKYLELYFTEVDRFEHLKKIDFYKILSSIIPYEFLQKLEQLLPSSIKVPSGSNIRYDYSSHEPILKVKIQEVFGLKQSPRVLNEKLEVCIHLLNPALRPIQITKDLNSFWKNSYKEVRAEQRGKYKKHYWPENPLQAQATSKTKKNM